MLPQVESLPGAECESAGNDRNDLARVGQHRAHVSGHVVGALVVVFPGSERRALRRGPLDPSLEIAEDRWIGVLLDGQAGRGMAHKDGAQSALDRGLRDDRSDSRGEVREPATMRSHFDLGLVNHRRDLG
jgi:hypothetical protein